MITDGSINLASEFKLSHDLELIQLRSGPRDPDLDINLVREQHEVFVHHECIPNHQPVEVHFPVEWVGLNDAGEIVFNDDGERQLNEIRELIRRYGPRPTELRSS